MKNRLVLYLRLVRLDKPVGILLLLWPTLGALWIAADGQPDWRLVGIFVVGTILMRSAGCAINDFADRDFDKHVKRTADRPLTAEKMAPWEALAVAAVLAGLAFILVLSLNRLAIQLSVIAVLIAATYPYFKRFFALPQAYLGIAFGFGIPMSFAAVQNEIPAVAWYLLIANIFWTLAYDTEYAMVDRDDDVKIGIRTSAITFGRFDVLLIMLCYLLMLAILLIIGWQAGLREWFLVGWGGAVLCAAYHYYLIRNRDRMRCFIAFRHNHWLGSMLFIGILLDYVLC